MLLTLTVFPLHSELGISGHIGIEGFIESSHGNFFAAVACVSLGT